MPIHAPRSPEGLYENLARIVAMAPYGQTTFPALENAARDRVLPPPDSLSDVRSGCDTHGAIKMRQNAEAGMRPPVRQT